MGLFIHFRPSLREVLCVLLNTFQDCMGGAQLLAERKPLPNHYFFLALQLQFWSHLKNANKEGLV